MPLGFVQAALPPPHPTFKWSLTLRIKLVAGTQVHNSIRDTQKWNWAFVLMFLPLGTSTLWLHPLMWNTGKILPLEIRCEWCLLLFFDGVSTGFDNVHFYFFDLSIIQPLLFYPSFYILSNIPKFYDIVWFFFHALWDAAQRNKILGEKERLISQDKSES